MTNYRELLAALSGAEVEYILIGGLAGSAHGSTRFTLDVDIVYKRSPQNLARLAAALAPHAPYLRGAPPGLPFRLDADTLRNGVNFTLETALGYIDLLGEAAGGGTYENLLPDSVEMPVYGQQCRVVQLARLIELKRAAGRVKDLDAIAELEAILDESSGNSVE